MFVFELVDYSDLHGDSWLCVRNNMSAPNRHRRMHTLTYYVGLNKKSPNP